MSTTKKTGFAVGTAVAFNADAVEFYPGAKANVIFEVVDCRLQGYPGAMAYTYTVAQRCPDTNLLRDPCVGVHADELHVVRS